jgi:hypothetical protein
MTPITTQKGCNNSKVFTFDKKSNNFWCQEGRHVTSDKIYKGRWLLEEICE